MSFGQDLYLLGAINETAYAHTGNPAYLAAAQRYYEEGVAMGPNRPQSLYGLFDVYRAEGNAESYYGGWRADHDELAGRYEHRHKA